jgi:hypothetical protein
METNSYLGIRFQPRQMKEVGSTIDVIKIHHEVTIFVDSFIILGIATNNEIIIHAKPK